MCMRGSPIIGVVRWSGATEYSVGVLCRRARARAMAMGNLAGDRRGGELAGAHVGDAGHMAIRVESGGLLRVRSGTFDAHFGANMWAIRVRRHVLMPSAAQDDQE